MRLLAGGERIRDPACTVHSQLFWWIHVYSLMEHMWHCKVLTSSLFSGHGFCVMDAATAPLRMIQGVTLFKIV